MKIENSHGYEIECDENVGDGNMIYIYNDWGTCMTFEFDSKEQIDQLIDMLQKLKEEHQYA